MTPDKRPFSRRFQRFYLHAVVVSVLTHGAQPKILKTWEPADIQKMKRVGTAFNSQKLIFDESTGDMDLNDRANIDLVTVYGKGRDGQPKVARVPRFLIWRDAFKIYFDSKTNSLNSRAVPSILKVPLDLFDIQYIEKIELSQHHETYPGTMLKVRTNPAASRGEKFFTQNCMACHSFNRPFDPTKLTADSFKDFATKHSKFKGVIVDSKDIRGMTAYSEALASEKSKVESSK